MTKSQSWINRSSRSLDASATTKAALKRLGATTWAGVLLLLDRADGELFRLGVSHAAQERMRQQIEAARTEEAA